MPIINKPSFVLALVNGHEVEVKSFDTETGRVELVNPPPKGSKVVIEVMPRNSLNRSFAEVRAHALEMLRAFGWRH